MSDGGGNNLPVAPASSVTDEAEILDDSILLEPDVEDLTEAVEVAEVMDSGSATPPPTRRSGIDVSDIQDISDEDQGFVERVFNQVREVDFRNPPPPPPRNLTGLDKKMEFLRGRVRELERDLARVGFVWQIKNQRIQAVERIIAAKEQERAQAVSRHEQIKTYASQTAQQYKAESQAQKQRIAELEEHLADVRADRMAVQEQLQSTQVELEQTNQRFTDAVARLKTEQQSLLEDFRGKMEQAQQAFNALREQSQKTITEREQEISAQTEKQIGTQHELDVALSSLSDRAQAIASLEDERTALRQEIQGKDADLMALEKSLSGVKDELVKSQGDGQRTHAELLETRSNLSDAEERIQNLSEELARQRHESAEQMAAISRALTALEEKKTDLEQELASAQGTLTQRDDALAQERTEKERLAAELEGTSQQLNEAQHVSQNVQSELEQSQNSMLELQTTLNAVEEELRLAREDAARVSDQAAAQESVAHEAPAADGAADTATAAKETA